MEAPKRKPSGARVVAKISFMCGRWESEKHARPESESIKASDFGL